MVQNFQIQKVYRIKIHIFDGDKSFRMFVHNNNDEFLYDITPGRNGVKFSNAKSASHQNTSLSHR